MCVKPYIIINNHHDVHQNKKHGPTLKNISDYCVFSKGYTLILELNTIAPHKQIMVHPGVPDSKVILPVFNYEIAPPSEWYNRFTVCLKYHKETLMQKELILTRYAKPFEATENIRSLITDWINIFQATVNNSFDVSGAVWKAIKWFDDWHNEQLVKDIIE